MQQIRNYDCLIYSHPENVEIQSKDAATKKEMNINPRERDSFLSEASETFLLSPPRSLLLQGPQAHQSDEQRQPIPDLVDHGTLRNCILLSASLF